MEFIVYRIDSTGTLHVVTRHMTERSANIMRAMAARRSPGTAFIVLPA